MHGYYQPMQKRDSDFGLKEAYQLWVSVNFAFFLNPVLQRRARYL